MSLPCNQTICYWYSFPIISVNPFLTPSLSLPPPPLCLVSLSLSLYIYIYISIYLPLSLPLSLSIFLSIYLFQTLTHTHTHTQTQTQTHTYTCTCKSARSVTSFPSCIPSFPRLKAPICASLSLPRYHDPPPWPNLLFPFDPRTCTHAPPPPLLKVNLFSSPFSSIPLFLSLPFSLPSLSLFLSLFVPV